VDQPAEQVSVVRPSLLGEWVRATLPSGKALPDADWERHHKLVMWVLLALLVAVPAYSAARGSQASHVVGYAVPLVVLTLGAGWNVLSRRWREVAAVMGLMTASALAVDASHGATEAHFMFFALLPLAAVYAAWTPFVLAVGYVAVHHFALGALVPASVFDHEGSVLGMAALHAVFVLVESLACLVAWRLFEDRRELVERLVVGRTAELSEQRNAATRMAAVVESTDDAVITTTPEGAIVTWNPAAERLYGYAAAEVVGEHIAMVHPPEGQGSFGAAMSALARNPSVSVERPNIRRDGTRFEASVTVSTIRDDAGTVTGLVGIARDITERKRRETEALATARKLEAQAEELARLALHDPLTGLANRALMHDRLEHAVATRRAGETAVLLLDLDNFKSVNDLSGHAVGDGVLIEAARRLRSCVRPTDTVARLGGDEFVVLVEDIEDAGGAVTVADRILTALGEPIEVGDETFAIDASVGITVTDGRRSRGPTELLRDADIAMYAAKAAGKGRYAFFETDMHDKLVAHTKLVRDLHHAVADGQLRLLYQPQVDLSSGHMTGVEALVRWEHPQRGLIGPDQFIPTAESTGTIVAIDDWVLREACHQLRAWDDAGLEALHMAVNVSARRLVSGDLADTIAAALQTTMVDPARLEIEITETVAVRHEANAVEAIKRVRALGLSIAIDDFGMGHSALSRLQSFPVDRLKIDRSFVASLTEGSERGSIADAMIAMGQSLGLYVVAEGVETHEHLRALRTLGCPSAQGYLFSKPVPATQIERLAHDHTALAVSNNERATYDLAPRTSSPERDRQIRNLLGELQRVTGLESVYLTRIDWNDALQHVTHAHNAGGMDIPEGLTVDWGDTICRRALEQGVTYTDEVPATFPDSCAGQDLGLQTYVSVPLHDSTGDLTGTLCGASHTSVPLGPETIRVMERFAQIISSPARQRDPDGVS